MGTTPNTRDIDVTPAAFDTANNDLLVVTKKDYDEAGNEIAIPLANSLAVKYGIANGDNLIDDLVRLFARRLGRYASTVSGLEALGTDDGIAVGEITSLTTGQRYRCLTAAASTSTWIEVGGIGSWQNIDPTLLSGTTDLHLNFDGDLTAETGQAVVLTAGGNTIFGKLNGVQGLHMTGTKTYRHSPADSGLVNLGAMTLAALGDFTPSSYGSTPATGWISMGTGSGSGVTNTNWMLESISDTWHGFHEQGSGSNQAHDFEVRNPSGMNLIVLVRETSPSDVYKLYMQGQLQSTAAITTMPDQGGDAAFEIKNLDAFIGGLCVKDEAASAAEVLALWNYVSGRSDV